MAFIAPPRSSSNDAGWGAACALDEPSAKRIDAKPTPDRFALRTIAPCNQLPAIPDRTRLRALFGGAPDGGTLPGAPDPAQQPGAHAFGVHQCEQQSETILAAAAGPQPNRQPCAAATDDCDDPEFFEDALPGDDDSQHSGCGSEREEELDDGSCEPQDCSELSRWLEQRGLAKYEPLFRNAGADLALLPCLKDADLQQMGITALGARKKVLLGAQDLVASGLSGAPPPVAARPAADFGSVAASYGIASFFAAPAQPSTSAPVAGGSILRYLQGPDGQAPKVAAAAPAPLAGSKAQYARKKEWAHTAAAGGGGKGGRGWGPRAAAVLPFKSWQVVPGTSFVVDRFCNLPATPPQQCHWFLTHFHADHYKGLTSKFDRGTIYCTPITAALVRQQLRVAPARLHEVAIGSTLEVAGVRVTFLDANHCPGAAMLLFHPPGRRPVLHTGDCRLTEAAQALPELAAVRGDVDLILDTTYCDPQYAFPPQPEVLQFAVDAVKAEAFNPRTLFLFGSYTIGKERLYLEAARVLNRKIYVSTTKKKVLDCLGLGPEYASLLTTDDSETSLHAVPMWMVGHKHMASALRHYRGRFDNVVGFQPTGWTHEKDAAASRRRGRRKQKGTLITYQVPYSEHSSFTELKAFVAWLQPKSILPHVNNDGGGPKAQRMVALLRGHDR